MFCFAILKIIVFLFAHGFMFVVVFIDLKHDFEEDVLLAFGENGIFDHKLSELDVCALIVIEISEKSFGHFLTRV